MVLPRPGLIHGYTTKAPIISTLAFATDSVEVKNLSDQMKAKFSKKAEKRTPKTQMSDNWYCMRKDQSFYINSYYLFLDEPFFLFSGPWSRRRCLSGAVVANGC